MILTWTFQVALNCTHFHPQRKHRLNANLSSRGLNTKIYKSEQNIQARDTFHQLCHLLTTFIQFSEWTPSIRIILFSGLPSEIRPMCRDQLAYSFVLLRLLKVECCKKEFLYFVKSHSKSVRRTFALTKRVLHEKERLTAGLGKLDIFIHF